MKNLFGAFLLSVLCITSYAKLWDNEQGNNDEACAQNIWPIFAGGGNRDLVNCFAYHAESNLILVGGNTTSSDFAPAANEHGYLYALDMDGNFKWGRFFYNVSYAVSDISGCQLSSDGASLAVFGKGKSQPIVMEMDIAKGTSKNFLSMEYYLTSDTVTPAYETFGAIYYDKKDYFNGKPYYYLSFLMDKKLEMVRMEAPQTESGSPRIDWSYEFYDFTAAEASDKFRRKEPMNIYPDPIDNQVFYLTGRYQGNASIMRFQKINGRLKWYVKLEKMSQIRAWTQVPLDRHFYACGDWEENYQADNLNTAKHSAAVFRMRNDGNMIWYSTFSGTNAVSTKEKMDRCFGISYNYKNSELTVLIQGKATEMRSSTYKKGDFYDTFLILLDMNGRIKRGTTISFADTQYDTYIANNGLLEANGYYFWAGWAYGFSTRAPQRLVKSTTAPDFDVFTFKYKFDMDQYTCLWEYERESSDIEPIMNRMVQPKLGYEGIFNLFEDDDKVRKSRKSEYFVPYTSRYSGGFALLDTMKIPRPCAFKSLNLTSQDYYRGQKTLDYKITANNRNAFGVTLLDGNSKMIYQDGKDASDLAKFDKTKYSVGIQTDKEDAVGIQRTIIRNCDGLNRLLELNLYINVLSNTHPDFTTEMTTTFALNLNDTYTYKLPPVKDSDGNDEPEVYLKTMEAQEDQYPKFLKYDNSSRSLIFRPVDRMDQGKIFYFTTVVKEKNSDSIMYPYYCTVKINGNKLDFRNSTTNMKVNYTINWIDKSSQGSIKFTHPVNFTWLEDNFYLMFNIFWRDTTYNKRGGNKLNHTLADFELTKFNENGQVVNFTMVFDEPYLLGLLIKKSDRLYIQVRPDFNHSGLFPKLDRDNVTTNVDGKDWIYMTNITTWELFTKEANKRIPLLFDWRNPMMTNLRNIAKNTYWVVIGIILAQFVLLLWRRVGLLPLWILIEYLQLVAFMPIYNFRLIPYLYDAFKPSLVSHLIIFDETPFYKEFDDDYFNDNYKNYWLSVGRLGQAFVACILILILLLIANLIFFLMALCMKNNTGGCAMWVKRSLSQFKFNLYIRYYMLVYFDLTFFSVMKIIEGDNSTTMRKMAVLLSYVLFVISIVMPVFLISIIFRRFAVLKLKEAKKSFNTLLLKIDKGSKWRVINPAYFFARRLLTALLLTLPIENTFIFLQYVFILMSSHAYILYIVACKPYQTPGYNSYVLANETFYSALIIAIFIFSDATPELNIKIGAGVALMSSLILLILSNLVMNVSQMYFGRESIKKTIRESKLKRAEKEALEEAEEQERRLKKKKEEEEFTRLPDEAGQNSLSQTQDQSNTTHGNTTLSELNLKSNKKNKLKKGEDDSITEGQIGGLTTTDFGNKAGRRNKNKNKQDDVTDGQMPGTTPGNKKVTPTPGDSDMGSNAGGSEQTPAPRRKKTRKSAQNADADTGSNDPSKQ